MKFVIFDKDANYIKDFVALPGELYSKYTLMEDAGTMKSLLWGKHPLSKYFEITGFLVYRDEKAVGRCAITKYPGDCNAYIGFYECIDEDAVAKFMFDSVASYAKSNGYDKLVGPVDASFWIKYRLKINLFDIKPYTGEPYNKEYYFKQFKDNGYQVCEHYTSNIYKTVPAEYANEKYDDRLKSFLEKGYEIKSPALSEFEKTLRQVYVLLTDLYSDFPIYKDLSEADFVSTFMSYKSVLNPDMVKMAYYNEQLEGFFISVPNYSNLVCNVNISKLFRILKLRKKPKEYVMLYMGVSREHKGLGKALAGSIMEELRHTNLPSIGALARDGKVTQNYAEDMIEERYEYVLLERKLKDEA